MNIAEAKETARGREMKLNEAQANRHEQKWYGHTTPSYTFTSRDGLSEIRWMYDVRREDGEKKISNLVVFVLRLIELLATYRCEEERFHYYCWFFVFFFCSSSLVPLSSVVFYLFSIGRVRLFDLFYFYFGTDDGTNVTWAVCLLSCSALCCVFISRK